MAGEPGLEPGMRDPKSRVLPLHHSPIDNGIMGDQFRTESDSNTLNLKASTKLLFDSAFKFHE